MKRQISTAGPLRGEARIPGDKSISHRAVLLSSIAKGTSEIRGFLKAADPLSTLACVAGLGVEYKFDDDILSVRGDGLRGYRSPRGVLDAGNSGTTIRLLTGLLAGQKFGCEITGDEYLVRRPMRRIIEPLRLMGANIKGTEHDTAPLRIGGVDRLEGITYELPVPSAQVKSSVLLAGLLAEGTTTVVESLPTRDHTERMLGLSAVNSEGRRSVIVHGGTLVEPRSYFVPGDPSSAAFFVVAAMAISGSEILVRDVGLNPTRIGYLGVLRKMGGKIEFQNERTVSGEPVGDLLVSASDLHNDVAIDGVVVPTVIDELPILAVAAALGEGRFEVSGAGELRSKESDRIEAVVFNLRLMGLTVDERSDGFAFQRKKRLLPSNFRTFGDHRIAMAFGVASLAILGNSSVDDASCVDISYPAFWETIEKLTNA